MAAIRIETLAERRHGADTPTAKAAVEQAWSEMDEWTLERMSPKKASATKDGEDPSARLNIAPFPRPFLRNELAVVDVAIPDVYWAGHHNEASFGAVPYLLQVRHNNKPTWVMVDTPKYSTAAVQDILSVTGADHEPEYLFLTLDIFKMPHRAALSSSFTKSRRHVLDSRRAAGA